MALEYNEGYDVLLCAWEQVSEERLFMRWVNGAQDQMSYEEFKKKLGVSNHPGKVEIQSEDEILKKVKGIIDGTVCTSGENRA